MSQITGSNVPLKLGDEIYLVSYVSMAEWETFNDLLIQKSEGDEALSYLIWCSLQRAGCKIDKKKVLSKFAKHLDVLVDTICKASLPNLKVTKIKVNRKEQEINLKASYRVLSRMHGWTPEQISSMSPAQIFLYLVGGKTGTGIEKMTDAQYANLLASRER